MRCDEIQEHSLIFFMMKAAILQENTELREHLRTCSACRRELEELKQTRKYLQLWKDESPLQNISIAGPHFPRPEVELEILRYAGDCGHGHDLLLALANTQITWNKNGFSFSTPAFPEDKSMNGITTQNPKFATS